MIDRALAHSVFFTLLWAALFGLGAVYHSDRVQFAAFGALCWNVGLDLGLLLRERRTKGART
jgi:hypothetical protein